MINIRNATSTDLPDILQVNRQAFGREEEGTIVERIVESGAPVISLVAVDESIVGKSSGKNSGRPERVEPSNLVGHILFSPMITSAELDDLQAVAIGPMSVLPERQREGIGSMLVREGLQRAIDAGYDFVSVLGHPDYYHRFGFRSAKPLGITSNYDVPPQFFMVRELRDGVLTNRSGVVTYHEGFQGS